MDLAEVVKKIVQTYSRIKGKRKNNEERNGNYKKEPNKLLGVKNISGILKIQQKGLNIRLVNGWKDW